MSSPPPPLWITWSQIGDANGSTNDHREAYCPRASTRYAHQPRHWNPDAGCELCSTRRECVLAIREWAHRHGADPGRRYGSPDTDRCGWPARVRLTWRVYIR